MNEKKSLILMVEDEEQVLNTNCRMLRRRGYDVRTAQTAAEACHQLEEYLPDLLILDIMLPDGNGLDICRRFREKTMNPVLFLTGKSDIRDDWNFAYNLAKTEWVTIAHQDDRYNSAYVEEMQKKQESQTGGMNFAQSM